MIQCAEQVGEQVAAVEAEHRIAEKMTATMHLNWYVVQMAASIWQP